MISQINRFLVFYVVAIVIITSFLAAYRLDFSSRWSSHVWPHRIPLDQSTHYRYDDITVSPPAKTITLEDIVHALWKPLVTSITAESFVDHNGVVQTLGKVEQHWTAPLGNKLCIVDIDTRPLSNEHQIFNPENVAWKDLDMVGSGMLNHYLYGTSSSSILPTPSLLTAN